MNIIEKLKLKYDFYTSTSFIYYEGTFYDLWLVKDSEVFVKKYNRFTKHYPMSHYDNHFGLKENGIILK